MIQSFLDSWPLFHNAYLSGWFIAVLLPLIGVIVVARDQIFLGAAVAQAATLGLALGMWMTTLSFFAGLHFMGSDAWLSGMAIIFSVLAALLTAWADARERESQESVTGWVFLAGASVSVLLLSHSPHGLEEIHRLLSSSLIGARRFDVWMFGGLSAAALLAVRLVRERIILWIIDPAMAGAVGMRVRGWSMGVAVLLGAALGLTIRNAGMLFAFGALVLPGLTARTLCRTVAPMFTLAPILGLAGAVLGFVLANHYDYPPAQMTVALWCGGVLAARVWRRGRLE